MKKGIKLVVAGAALVVAIGLYVSRSSETKSPTDWTEHNASLQCMGCGHAYTATVQLRDQPPYVCPKCGKREAWMQKQCRKCGEVFLPPLEGDPPWPPMIATCPKCGSTTTGAVRMETRPKE